MKTQTLRPTLRPTLKQHLCYQALLDTVIKYVVFGGGGGGGKSWLGCEWLITQCYKYPGSKWFIGREELKRLMQSTYVTFTKVCKQLEIPMDDWSLNGQYNYIQFKNGSRIDLVDLKYLPTDPMYERFGSLEYTGGWIEEAGEVEFLAFDVMKSRIGRHMNREHGLIPKLLITCNPKKNWLYTLVYKPWRDGYLDREYCFIQALYKDNPHTAEEYGKQLADISDNATKQRLMFGNWDYDDDPSVLIRYDSIIDMWTNHVEENGERYLVADIARYGRDKTVITYWEGLKFLKFWEFTKQSLTETAQKLKDIAFNERVAYSHIIIDEDGVGGGVVDMMPGVKGFMANSSPTMNRTTNMTENYANLKAQCAYKLADIVNAHGMAVAVDGMSQKVKDTIVEELGQIKSKDLDKDRKKQIVPKDEVKEAIGRSPDYGDNFIMRVWFELPGVVPTGIPAKVFYPSHIRR